MIPGGPTPLAFLIARAVLAAAVLAAVGYVWHVRGERDSARALSASLTAQIEGHARARRALADELTKREAAIHEREQERNRLRLALERRLAELDEAYREPAAAAWRDLPHPDGVGRVLRDVAAGGAGSDPARSPGNPDGPNRDPALPGPDAWRSGGMGDRARRGD